MVLLRRFPRLASVSLILFFVCKFAAGQQCLTDCNTDLSNCMANLSKIKGGTRQGCIAGYNACKNLCSHPLPKVTSVGQSCKAAVCSASHLACYDGECACQPGYVACGAKCVDVASDEQSCGACGVSCGRGEKCDAGQCRAAGHGSSTPKDSKVGKAFDVTPGYCGEYESHPVLSANKGVIFQAAGSGGGGQLVSWADVDSPATWKISGQVKAAETTNEANSMAFQPPACGPKGKAPQDKCPLVAGGDVWATTSGFSGLEYVAARTSWDFYTSPFKNPSNTTHTSGPGLLSPTVSELKSGKLAHARWVIPANEADDGLTAAYDAGGTSLWIAATCQDASGTSSGHPCTFLFPYCTGAVNTSTCRRARIGAGNADFVDPMLNSPDKERGNAGHTTVLVNPCTHHALVSFLEEDSSRNGFVTVVAIDNQGKIVAKWQKRAFLGMDTRCPDASKNHVANCTSRPLCPDPTATNTNCCSTSENCNAKGTPSAISRVVARAQMGVKVWGEGANAKCTAYVGWDDSKGEPGAVRHAATLSSIDVTGKDGNESSKSEFKTLTQVRHAGESMNATPVASRFGDALALIYVQRNAAGTTETLRARVSRNRDFDNFTDLAVSDKSPNSWFGDSLSELLGGLPGDQLLATWPELSSSGCVTIDGALLTVGSEAGQKIESDSAAPPRVMFAEPQLWKDLPDDGEREK